MWHVLTVAPQAEFRADEAARQMGYQTLLPLDYVIKRRNMRDRAVVTPIPAMRGYLAIGSDATPNWAALRAMRGPSGRPIITGALGHDHMPAPISALAVRQIREMCTDGPPEAIAATRQLRVGEVAIISAGPYAGHRVIVRRLRPKTTSVLMTLFGAMREVDIVAENLQAAA